jgi:hypothetical protein
LVLVGVYWGVAGGGPAAAAPRANEE